MRDDDTVLGSTQGPLGPFGLQLIPWVQLSVFACNCWEPETPCLAPHRLPGAVVGAGFTGEGSTGVVDGGGFTGTVDGAGVTRGISADGDGAGGDATLT